MNPNAPTSWGLAAAVAAGTAVMPDMVWVPVPEDDVLLSVPRDAIKLPFPQAGGRVMRAPCSYKEWLDAARSIGACSMAVNWGRAAWRAAPRKQTPVELVVTAADAEQMGTLAFLVRSEDMIDAQVADYGPNDWGRGAMKCWYVDPMMMELGVTGVCNWGFVHPGGTVDQSPGGRHTWEQVDYSQKMYDWCMRWARRISDGSWVDVVEVLCAKFAANAALVARIRREYGPPPPRPDRVDAVGQ